jgi:hypothetical protein
LYSPGIKKTSETGKISDVLVSVEFFQQKRATKVSDAYIHACYVYFSLLFARRLHLRLSPLWNKPSIPGNKLSIILGTQANIEKSFLNFDVFFVQIRFLCKDE